MSAEGDIQGVDLPNWHTLHLKRTNPQMDVCIPQLGSLTFSRVYLIPVYDSRVAGTFKVIGVSSLVFLNVPKFLRTFQRTRTAPWPPPTMR